MRPRLINLEAATAALKPFLKEYLESFDLNTAKNFRCINPKHDDSTASMTCKQFEEEAFCFGCGQTADIFAAANLLEGKPLTGKGFIEENVRYLADKFGVTLQLEDLTPEEAYEFRTYRAYQLAASLIADPKFGDYSAINKEIKARGWDKKKLAEWGIGTVDYTEYKARMKAAGYEVSFLNGIDLDRSNLFNNHNLLFTVYDDEGRPVGFSAKNLKYKSDDNRTGPKYINTRATGLECAIFKKGTRLYGFDIAKECHGPLYIFEGQADVITARHSGLMNCCCTMGTALTDFHVDLLKRQGIFNIILVFDGDEAGELAVEKAVDDKFAKEKDFRIKLCQLPEDMDPDELIRTKGYDEFIRLRKRTAFEWRMIKFKEEIGDEPEEDQSREIAEKMTSIIVSEPSHLKQEEMCKQVAMMTGYDMRTIISEVRRLRDEKEAAVQTRKKNAIEALLNDVKRNPQDAEIALVQCQTAINDINKAIQSEGETSSTLNALLSIKEKDEAKTGEFAGFFMRPDGIGGIASRLNDDWRTDTLVYIGGGEQAGKTTLCTQMAVEIAEDERNNAICIYHSIDDAKHRIFYKWACQISGKLELYLNHISSPNYWKEQEGFDYVPKVREAAYKQLTKLITDNKLVIKDASDGASLAYIESVIKYYREVYPEQNIVLCIDNFHKLPDYAEITGHERVKRLSNHLKNMTVSNGITVISTVEYRKLQAGEKPSNVAIAESRSLAYDSDVILHLYNDLHHNDEAEAILLHEDLDALGVQTIMPRIWCKFGKNKISGYEGREFLDLYPLAGQMRAVDLEAAIADQRARIEFLKENKASNTKY